MPTLRSVTSGAFIRPSHRCSMVSMFTPCSLQRLSPRISTTLGRLSLVLRKDKPCVVPKRSKNSASLDHSSTSILRSITTLGPMEERPSRNMLWQVRSLVMLGIATITPTSNTPTEANPIAMRVPSRRLPDLCCGCVVARSAFETQPENLKTSQKVNPASAPHAPRNAKNST